MTSTEEREGGALLGVLAQEPPAVSRVDVGETMRAGARLRRRRRRVVGAGVPLVLAGALAAGVPFVTINSDISDKVPSVSASVSSSAAVPAAPSLPARCDVTRLPTDGVKKAIVTAMDHTGTYAAGRVYDTGERFDHPLVIWKDGRLAGTVRMAGSDQSLDAINSHGDAVGSSFVEDERQRPFAFVGGAMLELPGSGDGGASAINDAGRIGGVLDGRPVVWETATSRPTPVPLPAGTSEGSVNGIAEDGTVLFTAGGYTEAQAYLWFPDGKVRKLPLGPVVYPGEPERAGTGFWAEAISGDWVTGRIVAVEGSGMGWSGYRYNLAEDRLEILPQAQSPTAVAANGWVAVGDRAPALAGPDGSVPLEAYGTQPETDYLISGISDDGRTIAGYSAPPDDDVTNQPLLWRCS